MPAYAREKYGIEYYSPNAADADAELQEKLDVLDRAVEFKLMPLEEANAKREALQAASSSDVEVVEDNQDNLRAITTKYKNLRTLMNEVRTSQIEMFVRLLASGSIDVSTAELKRLTDEAPSVVRKWCDEPSRKFGEKKSGKLREGLSTNTVKKLDDLMNK